MGAFEKIDWEQAYDEFLLVHKPKGMTQYQFAETKQVTATWLSTRFNEIEAERLMGRNKTRMPKLLERALENISETLEEEPDRSTNEERTGISVEGKAKLSLATAIAFADRLGMSPQAVTINMQQNNSNKTVLSIPIFAASANPMLDKFLGMKNADTTTDS